MRFFYVVPLMLIVLIVLYFSVQGAVSLPTTTPISSKPPVTSTVHSTQQKSNGSNGTKTIVTTTENMATFSPNLSSSPSIATTSNPSENVTEHIRTTTAIPTTLKQSEDKSLITTTEPLNNGTMSPTSTNSPTTTELPSSTVTMVTDVSEISSISTEDDSKSTTISSSSSQTDNPSTDDNLPTSVATEGIHQSPIKGGSKTDFEKLEVR